MVGQLEKERLELVEYLMNVFEKGDGPFANRLLAMVEVDKFDLVMKICKEILRIWKILHNWYKNFYIIKP